MDKNTTNHPLSEWDDPRLIETILTGSREALEVLIVRHRGWIYNLALRMTLDHQDAEDVSQEILIKLITSLSTYQPEKSRFRTWLYRIVANHVLNMKSRKYEKLFPSFDACTDAIARIPDESIEGSPEQLVLVEELKIKCMTGMLLCLDRRHRLAFVMSEIFAVSNAEGREILDVSDTNYRKMLSRARKKVYNFINQNCGLVHPDNPCHCHKKLNGFIRTGFVDPDNLLFYTDQVKSIGETIRQNRDALYRLNPFEKAQQLMRHQPFYPPPDIDRCIDEILQCDKIGALL